MRRNLLWVLTRLNEFRSEVARAVVNAEADPSFKDQLTTMISTLDEFEKVVAARLPANRVPMLGE